MPSASPATGSLGSSLMIASSCITLNHHVGRKVNAWQARGKDPDGNSAEIAIYRIQRQADKA